MKIMQDELLTNKTANDLISCNKKEKLFIIKDFLNIYAALVKIQYPYRLKRGPYLTGKELGDEVRKFLDSLLPEYRKKNFLKVRKCIREYTGFKRYDGILPFWIKYNYFPFVFLRVMSLLKPKNEQSKYFAYLISLADNFASMNRTPFRPPLTLKELLNDSIVYFVGVAFGDCGVADHFKLFKITDGSSRKAELKFSKIFFEKLSRILKTNLCIKSKIFKDYENDNKYRIQFSNKWFNYYMNFFLGMPLGPKKNLLHKPLIINLSEDSEKLSKIFWRGIIDTDGCISNTISLEMADKSLILECHKDLKKYGMQPRYTDRDKVVAGKFYKEFCIRINRFDYKNFAENIGFSHPRKQLIFVNELLRKPQFKEQICKPKEVEKFKLAWSSPFSF